MTAAAPVSNRAQENRRQTLFLVLAGVFIGNALLAELIGGKLFQVPTPWHTFTLSCGIVLWPVVFVFTDIINEYFGRPGVRKMSFLAAAIIAYSFLALTAAGAVPAASFSPVDDASFSRVFTQSQWIIVGSIAAFLLAQLIDVTVFWFIRRNTGHRFLWLRATGSTVISQLIDTFVVGFVGLHLPTYFGRSGPNLAEFINAGFSGYLFKFVIALAVTPLLYVVHRVVDGYLGERAAHQLIEAVASTEHADDAHLHQRS
ncbi:MAG TPA: queuosine precursor transporter [Myxococcota bacterium]|nr:queuosine precursor transporter [Myxococcota bacterium]